MNAKKGQRRGKTKNNRRHWKAGKGRQVRTRHGPVERISSNDSPSAARRSWLRSLGEHKLPLILIVISVIALIVYPALPSPGSLNAILPLEFRIDNQDLSGLPVAISELQTCGCWTGPRIQAEKKFKLTIENHSKFTLNIGGGESSSIRLIVGYPKKFTPKLTVPDYTAGGKEVSVANPPDIGVREVSTIRQTKVSLIPNGPEIFPLPPGYRVWAIPPTPNKVVETYGAKATFPTVVDQETLRTGETYGSSKLGHGDWVFYVPLDENFASAGDFELILPRSETEKHAIVLGIAVFAETQSHEDPILVGFAAAPPDSAALSPADL